MQSPRPWLGCTCGNRHSFASSAWSGFGSGSGHRSLEFEVNCLPSSYGEEPIYQLGKVSNQAI